jgi:hypothetical protein
MKGLQKLIVDLEAEKAWVEQTSFEFLPTGSSLGKSTAQIVNELDSVIKTLKGIEERRK